MGKCCDTQRLRPNTDGYSFHISLKFVAAVVAGGTGDAAKRIVAKFLYLVRECVSVFELFDKSILPSIADISLVNVRHLQMKCLQKDW